MRPSLFVVISSVVFASAASGQFAHVSQDLGSADPSSTVNVIVQYKQSPEDRHHARVRGLGGVLNSDLHVVKGDAYSMPARNVAILAADPDVTSISVDRKIHRLLDNTTAAVNAAAAWSAGLDGSGIGVAVIDSGISEHDDLQGANGSRIVYRESFINSDTNDDFGHGEHVAGILAGNGSDSNCSSCSRHLVGMAPNVNMIDLQVLDGKGEGSDSAVIAAIDRAIQLQSQFNIRVINLSLGRPVYESYTQDPLCQAVEAAWQAGIVVVVAAGNDGRNNSVGNNGYGTISAPGNDPYVITVGAMNSMGTPGRSDDQIASYSSKGPTPIDHIVKPDLVAPGNRVVSLMSSTGILQGLYPQNLVPLSYYQSTGSTSLSSSYFMLSGTSMATPVVSGAAALLLQQNPQLTPDQVKFKLMLTAYKTFPATSTATDPVSGQSFTSEYDVFTVGAGYLDVQAALADNTPFTGTALSPAAAYTPRSGNAYLVCYVSSVCDYQLPSPSGPSFSSAQSIWGMQAVGGDQSIWGNPSNWGNQLIWGLQTIWGDQTLWGDQGDQTLWGDQTIWGDLFSTDAQTSNLINPQP